ncbi:hypothetical protein SAY86_016152 [Trapa natans]|uniref:C3H1-type domain-containing protein n=1 Tax=Trapa natans TaxID=22666 RepID=A0AAN7LJ26_TRANT|nr:hypothetical protein SAY86_016152 [Trapa natans]
MESKNFLKWLFRPNPFSSSSSCSSSASPSKDWAFHLNPSYTSTYASHSKAYPEMPTPDLKLSPSPPRAPLDSFNAPLDPDHVAADQLAAEVQQLCLRPLESDNYEEAEGRDSHPRKEDEESPGEAKDRQDHGPDGAEEESHEMNEDGNESNKDDGSKKERLDFGRKNKFPVRPEAEECSFYMKKGTCKFGSNCKFNHPIRRRPQAEKEKSKDKEESKEKNGQVECKYYLMPGGCKYGKACRYNHCKANFMAPAAELNFMGLPIRPGEKECPFYMRTGTCKFSANCKFNHPDPTSGADSPMDSSHLHAWFPSGTNRNDCPPYVPMMHPPTHVISSPNAEWDGYQFPLNLQLQGQIRHHPPAYVMNSSTTNHSHIYTNNQQHSVVEEFPERPSQAECSYFLKTGDCKFRSNCKYHHPKQRAPKSPQLALSDKGLPLRPNMCSFYRRYGICKLGPACKFDHSIQLAPSGLERQSSTERSLGEDYVPSLGRHGR